jgi:hypothetical protein
LSNAAVERMVLRVLTKDVLPESTCPMTPLLMFRWVGVEEEAVMEAIGGGEVVVF